MRVHVRMCVNVCECPFFSSFFLFPVALKLPFVCVCVFFCMCFDLRCLFLFWRMRDPPFLILKFAQVVLLDVVYLQATGFERRRYVKK